jgi:hypothetical protein
VHQHPAWLGVRDGGHRGTGTLRHPRQERPVRGTLTIAVVGAIVAILGARLVARAVRAPH